MSLPSFSLRQVVLVNILFFVCLLGGLVAYLRAPVDFFPEISFNAVVIQTLWTGASAEEVERLVTTRVEDEIGDIEGIDEIRSISQPDVSTVLVAFDETMNETQYEAAVNDLRAAIDRVVDLPGDAEEPVIRELSTKEVWSDLRVAVTDIGGVGETPIHLVAADVEALLERLPGIERVTVRGAHEREIWVLVDRDSAARYGLTVVEVVERIRRKNLNLPAGTFDTPGGQATLRATGDYRSVEEILDTVVRENENGTNVRLSEVARIERRLEKRRFYTRYNGQPALVLGIAKDDDAHLIDVSRRVDEFIAAYSRVLPEGVALYKTWDTSRWVESRMGVLWDNLVTGVCLVMAILWFTIGFRNAALTIVAIPFSFLTALIFFPLAGITINSISLVGMLLVSGMLVDDAIIVLENVYRRIEEGEPLRTAIIQGSEEVLWPVVAAVSTTCAAFAPLLLMGGISGKFMEILPETVIVCLLASLFECLVILPAHYLDLGSRGPAARQGGISGGGGAVRRALLGVALGADAVRVRVDRGLAMLRAGYLRALDVVLASPGSFAVLSVALVWLAVNGARHLHVDLFPSEISNFFVTLEAPTDYSLEQTNELMRGAEAQLQALVGEHFDDYFTNVGNAITGSEDQRVGSNLAVSFVWIADREDYREKPANAVKLAQERLDAYRASLPEVEFELQAKPPREGPPIGRPVAMRIESDDYALAKQIALEVQRYLHALPGVSGIEDSLQQGPREIRLVVDEERATRHGLDFRALATALRAANEGLVASSFRGPAETEDLDIRVLLEPRFRRGIEDLLQTQVRTPGGYLVKLGDVAQVEITRGFLEYWHYDRRRGVTVYADVDDDLATALDVNRALEARFADVPLRHPEVTLRFGGEFEETRETIEDMLRVFPVALLLIYGILAALFRSYLQPLVVATAIPFGIIGVVVGTALLDYNLSIYMMYATLGLTGVVVNDSLVMVDFINRARASGMPLLEAVRVSGARRLRPILLTTATTVVALTPMALGLHGGSASFGPFAASITFGLIFGMVGTLFIVPLAYTALVRVQQRLRPASVGPEDRDAIGEGGRHATG